ncbi:hypothetical protein R3P38DRAFT_767022 [Favolaschia claudopus]|uniref:Secreted protein n=1 Tax=Favolaschia claudopus TaxID=2862362 RepID=A0AAW0C063_9AGAR
MVPRPDAAGGRFFFFFFALSIPRPIAAFPSVYFSFDTWRSAREYIQPPTLPVGTQPAKSFPTSNILICIRGFYCSFFVLSRLNS